MSSPQHQPPPEGPTTTIMEQVASAAATMGSYLRLPIIGGAVSSPQQTSCLSPLPLSIPY